MQKYLDAILLLIFSFLFTQFKRDVTTVSEIYIPFIIFLNFIYFLVSFLESDLSFLKKHIFKIKIALIFLILLISVGKSTVGAIRMRHLHPNSYPVHDNPIQIEQAARYLYQGKNPYSETYKGIGMEKSWPQNPAVYHVITMPFYLIFSAVVLYPINFLTNYFDERLVHWLVFLPALFLLFKLFKKQKKEHILLFIIVFFFNPFFVHFLISGRNDVFIYSLLIFCFYALFKNKYFLSSFFFGLAFVSKQSSWLLAPFFFYYFYLKSDNKYFLGKIKEVIKKTWIFFAIISLFIIPFLIWDTKGFMNGVYYFPAGNLKTSFPIMGYGFSSILREARILKDSAYFPFQILQMIFGLPVLILCLRYMKKHVDLYTFINAYTIFLFIFWFFSRFFLDNYIGFLIMLFLTAELFRTGKKK